MRILIDRLFALVFSAILVAPLLQMAARIVPEAAVEQRREPRSVRAPLVRLAAMDPHLSDDVKGWFNDRFGFRSVLIRLKNEIDYQLFSSSDRVIVGWQGWLYDKGIVNEIVGDAGNAALDREILDSLRSFRDCLAQRGVDLVFVLNTTKSSLLPQFLPAKLPLDPPLRLARRLAEVLQRERGVIFIDAEQILSLHRAETLFHKIDIHMNLKASSYVYREMATRIARAGGKPSPGFGPESWRENIGRGGSEERFLAKFLPLDDIDYNTSSASGAMLQQRLRCVRV